MLNLKNTLDGYLKNVEVIGNTVQDTNNLANIRSVGDKVEGQELYKIDVVSNGKNLFNVFEHEDLLSNYDYTTSMYKCKYLKLSPNTTYTVSISASNNVGLLLINSNKEIFKDGYLDFRIQTSSKQTYRTDDTGLLYIGTSITDNDLVKKLLKRNIQIEEGTVATEYDSYKESKLEILSPVQLEKVGNVADRIICKDGVWGVEKNVEKLCLEPTNWIGYRVDTHVDAPTMSFMKTLSGKTTINETYVCNRFLNSGVLDVQTEGIQCLASNYIYISIFRSRLETEDVEGFMKWMNNNDVYVLKNSINPQFIPLPHDQQVKLRTFAGQTNIAFLTEIPGQIKAQVPKSLGATVNTHTEQIKDLHNSLERVKKLEETTVSTVETESNFTTVDATSNGYFEDVKLEGKTLVNLFNFLRLDIVSQVNIYVRAQNYALTKGKEVTLVNNTDKKVIYDIYKDSAWVRSVIPSANTCMKVALEGSEYIQCCYGARADGWDAGSETDKEKIKKTCIVLEGDHTNNPPEFFEGLMSVGQNVEEVSIESVAKNVITTISNVHNTKPIYRFDIPDMQLDIIKPYLKYFTQVAHYANCNNLYEYYYTESNNTVWLNLGTFNKEEALKVLNKRIAECEGNSNKKPLLYYNPTTETWEKPILRKWDTIEKHSDGKYYYHKRSGEVVLNGSDDILWTDRTSEVGLNGFARFSTKSIPNKASVKVNIFSDKLTCLPGEQYIGTTKHNTMENIFTHSDTNGNIYVTVSVAKLSTQDVAGFKAWLKANPTTVVYQLAQEEVYECTNIDLMTYNGETNYIINSGAISPKSLLKVHNNISNVVKILQEKVSLLENTFIAGLKSVLSGDMYSLATILYPEDFEQNDNTEQDIMVIPE